MATKGEVIQIIGSTFDAQFPETDIPDIYNAVKVEAKNRGVEIKIIGEVQ